MNHLATPRVLAALAGFALMTLSAPTILAAGADSATGTLSVEGPDKTLSAALTHAYVVVGPDTFEPEKITRRIVFTPQDERATIMACKDVSCATLSGSDGLTVSLREGSTPAWWAHVYPIQYSGSTGADALKTTVDTADRLAGTFTLDNPGAKATIEFDATLVKTFAGAKH